MFGTRLLSGIVLVALALFFIITGGKVLLCAALLISLTGMFELYRVFGLEKTLPAYAAYAAAAVYYAGLGWSVPGQLIFMAFLTVLMFVFVFAYPAYRTEQIAEVFFGFFYVAVMLSYVYRLRGLDGGLYLAFLVFLCSWGCDTCAYCVGKLIGRHKMSPKLSPKKSVEGAIGGIAGAALLTALYCAVFRAQMSLTGTEILLLAVAASIAGAISMVGDLTASAIKRNFDIKDYGNLIPGHGGIMDRFDSMIITAPLLYYLAFYML